VLSAVDIVLSGVGDGEMDEDEIDVFETGTKKWLGAKLLLNDPPVVLKDIEVVDQSKPISRRLQGDGGSSSSSLAVSFNATSVFTPSDTTQTKEDLDLDSKIQDIFENDSSSLVGELKTIDADYFDGVSKIQIQDVSNIEDPNAAIIDAKGNSGGSKKNWSLIVIAASASGCAALLFAFAMFAVVRKRRNNGLDALESDAEFDPELYEAPSSPKLSSSWEDLIPQPPIPNVRRYSRADNSEDEDTTIGGGVGAGLGLGGDITNPFDADDNDNKSQRTFNTLEKIYSNDKDNISYQSYGYSLEDGIATKASKEETITPKSHDVPSAGNMQMDLYGLNIARYDFEDDDETLEINVPITPGSVASGLTFETSRRSLVAGQTSAITPRQQQTEAQGAPIFEQDEVPKTSASTPPGEFIREINAPPGKLGVVIDTTRNGPVVHQVKVGSPLENLIHEGDKIIEIDGIDTTALSASNVTKIMARRVDESRKIKVKSRAFAGEL